MHPNAYRGYDVRYRDASGKHRSKSFRRKRDVERFDLQCKDAKQTGTLAGLAGGSETLDAYAEVTFAPVYVALLEHKTRELYRGLDDNQLSPWLGAYRLRELTPEVIGWQADRLAARARVESTRKNADATRRDPATRARGRADPEQPAAAGARRGSADQGRGPAARTRHWTGAERAPDATRRDVPVAAGL